MQQVEEIPLDRIEVNPRRRPTDPARVEQLRKSMEELGQLLPIEVIKRARKASDKFSGSYYVLITGLHRLEAARATSGWQSINAIVLEEGELDADELSLHELAENLHRAELSAEQRREWLAEYATIRERQLKREAELAKQMAAEAEEPEAPRVLADGRIAGPQHEQGLASIVAAETGVSTRTVQRALKTSREVRDGLRATTDADLAKLRGQELQSGLEQAKDALGNAAASYYAFRTPIDGKKEAVTKTRTLGAKVRKAHEALWATISEIHQPEPELESERESPTPTENELRQVVPILRMIFHRPDVQKFVGQGILRDITNKIDWADRGLAEPRRAEEKERIEEFRRLTYWDEAADKPGNLLEED